MVKGEAPVNIVVQPERIIAQNSLTPVCKPPQNSVKHVGNIQGDAPVSEDTVPEKEVFEENTALEEIPAEEITSARKEGGESPVFPIWEQPDTPRRIAVSMSVYAQTSPFGSKLRPLGSSGEAPGTAEQNPPSNPGTPGEDDPGSSSGGEEATPPESGGDDPGEDDGDENGSQSFFAPRRRSVGISSAEEQAWSHAFPVQVGARVSFSWSNRWSVESGLTYLHFTSWKASRRQNMEYLGIPLYVTCPVWNTGPFSLYASAGGQAFKCVAGNSPDRPWLFSAGIAAGAQWHLSRQVSLYAEPGVDRYFHTGESQNYYTAHPTAFSLSVGLRFHLMKK